MATGTARVQGEEKARREARRGTEICVWVLILGEQGCWGHMRLPPAWHHGTQGRKHLVKPKGKNRSESAGVPSPGKKRQAVILAQMAALVGRQLAGPRLPRPPGGGGRLPSCSEQGAGRPVELRLSSPNGWRQGCCRSPPAVHLRALKVSHEA